ncbi:EpsG family protein [Anaerotignum sp.]
MYIYLYIVAATLILGAVMPQRGKKRIWYIFLITLIHTFVCAFRYQHLTGDLMKYHNEFNTVAKYSWFSHEVLHEGRNSGFYLLMKLVNELTGGYFQFLLIVIAVITHIILAYMIYRYSPAPWLSYLVWNCMSFYIFGLNAIKQTLAMSFVMLSFVGIAEKRPKFYVGSMILAGLIHTPSLIFLPAYWLAQKRVNYGMILFYFILGVALYVFKNQFVDFTRSFYYEDDTVFVFSGEIGSRFIMILGFTLFAVLFKGFPNRDLEKLFHLMAIATMLQMLSGFDNIFTRLTDYYFQFSVLYIPMTFFPYDQKKQSSRLQRVFPFNERSLKFMSLFICIFIIWFYWTYNLNITIEYQVDNYLNYRFMWDVP